MADGADAMSVKDRLAALLAETLQAEAEAEHVLSDDETQEIALVERRDAARDKKKSVLLAQRRARLSQELDKAKTASNGAYVVDMLPESDSAEGSGDYIVRSPTREQWKVFREKASKASGDAAKGEMAYRQFAVQVILWPEIGEEIHARFDKYAALAQQIGDFAGQLGGIADRNRKS